MKKIGQIIWWGRYNYGIVETKNRDYSVEKFFLHRRNVIKCVPDKPAADSIVVFDMSTTPQPEGKLPVAINAEVYTSMEEALRLTTVAVSGVSR
jgi:hypothetical protein